MPGLDMAAIQQIIGKIAPPPQNPVAQLMAAKSGYGGQDPQGAATGTGPWQGRVVDPKFTGVPPDGGSDAGFIVPSENIGNIGPRTPTQFFPPGYGTVGGGGGGGGGNAGDMLQALSQAIIRRIGNSSQTAGPTSRVDPFNPWGAGSRWREDTSMPSQAGPDIPSAMAQEQAIAGQGRQTSNSPVPPQAFQDYLRQAVLSQLGKLPMGMGR